MKRTAPPLPHQPRAGLCSSLKAERPSSLNQTPKPLKLPRRPAREAALRLLLKLPGYPAAEQVMPEARRGVLPDTLPFLAQLRSGESAESLYLLVEPDH